MTVTLALKGFMLPIKAESSSKMAAVAVLESKRTGNWRSFWKVRAQNGKVQKYRGRGPIMGVK